jgi:peroxiredoxin
LVQLQKDLTLLREAGVRPVGISFDAVAVLKKFADEENIQFPLLSDEKSQTINAYGIHNKKGYPHPGTFLIDTEGVVRAAIFAEGYKKRHGTDELLEAVIAMNAAPGEDDTP